MAFMPFQILGIWFRGLLALAIPIVGGLLLKAWYDDSRVVERVPVSPAAVAAPAEPARPRPQPDRVVVVPAPDLEPAEPVIEIHAPDDRRAATPGAEVAAPARRVFRFDPGWNRATAYLAAGLLLLTWALAGRWIGHGLMTLAMSSDAASSSAGPGSGSGSDSGLDSGLVPSPSRASAPAQAPGPVVRRDSDRPRDLRTGQVRRIRRPDGSELHVECYGPDDAPTLVLTHGWGASSAEWYYEKTRLAGRFRLIVWDLPGLGFSGKPDNNDYRLENLAADLEAVLAVAGDRPVVLVGHSIGGMILQTFCRLFRETIARRVAGLAIVHSTYTNPLRTTRMATLYTALEQPVIVPLLRLTIAVWPLVWLMNWLSYWNGSLQRATCRQSFAEGGTPAQVQWLSRMMVKAPPDVLARGMLGMMAFDEAATLPAIGVPALVVIGDRDVTTLPEAGRFIVRNIPRSMPVMLAPARHLGLIQHHALFDRLLADFAGSCLAAATGVTT
jgi:pimeloyl-ACP methyl ester carboxylesterase